MAPKYKIVCVTQVYDELRKGNLERFVKYVMPLIDALVVYDDGSTDGSADYLEQFTPHVIRGEKNAFDSEVAHKKLLLDRALELQADFVFYLDADEVFAAGAESRLQKVCGYCEAAELDGILIHELNLWRSLSWRRVDNAYDEGWFLRLWRVTPGIGYEKIDRGLHLPLYPSTVKRYKPTNEIEVLHYGFASDRALAFKYFWYKAYGQKGWNLNRLLDERTLKLVKVPREKFPGDLWAEDEAPRKRNFKAALRAIEPFREEVLEPLGDQFQFPEPGLWERMLAKVGIYR